MEQGWEERRPSWALERALPWEGGSSVTLGRGPSWVLSELFHNVGVASARAAPYTDADLGQSSPHHAPLARASAVIDPNLQMGKLRVRQGKLLNVVQSAIYLTSSPYSTEVPDSANKVP